MKEKAQNRAWFFIAPSVILIVVFVFYPMIQAFVTSFQTGIGANLKFHGIANYQRLLTDGTFKKALWNTFIFLIVQVPIMIILALIISSMLNDKNLKCKGLFRTARLWTKVLRTAGWNIRNIRGRRCLTAGRCRRCFWAATTRKSAAGAESKACGALGSGGRSCCGRRL